MAPPKTTLWPIEPHTQAKHLILRRYLEAWLPMMASFSGRIHFFDGFAGPGRYRDGEDGSPIIALRTLLDHSIFVKGQFKAEAIFTFVERDPQRFAVLANELQPYLKHQRVKVAGYNKEFAEVLSGILDHLDGRGTRIASTFAFVDPFGFGGVPMELIARVMGNPRCECLITFMFESVHRFLAHPDASIQVHFDALFGTPAWRDLLALPPPQRRDRIISLYRDQLLSRGIRYIRTFEMIDKGNHTEYFLYFVTNSLDGLSKMKQAMWRADPVEGRAFSDYTDPQQMVLIESATDPVPLQDLLVAEFREKGWFEIADVERFVLVETPFSEAMHLKRRTLAPMETDKRIEVTRPSGKRNRPGEYPPGTSIRFV